ncbi:MAG: hypothetical protein M1834_006856 [Cirrosporium novae-zelandiae]|nr:MAG: hypothetical protein M1834_006856 [Cirrosporium novae-zelandiae]
MPTSQRPTTRRTSARLMEKEDALPNGFPKSVNSATGKQAASRGGGTAGSKRKVATYDEEDDGFTFTRTRSKRPKAQPPPEPEPIISKKEETAQTQERKRGRKRQPATTNGSENDQKPQRRKSARLSGATRELEQRTRGRRRKEENHDQEEPEPKKHPRSRKHEKDKDVAADDSIDLVGAHSPPDSRKGTKIALPFADTPIIKRNKEMRQGHDRGREKGQRRSSLGNRGRRASSLIDSGTSNGLHPHPRSLQIPIARDLAQEDINFETALPHSEVAIEDFYKHIESGLPEPRRMKQLLIWCGTRALGERPTGHFEDASERLAARAIQEELLKDFSNRSELSDWFSREETTPIAIVKKPNPQNIQNQSKIQELEEQLKRFVTPHPLKTTKFVAYVPYSLREERRSWESIVKNPIPPDPFSSPPDPSKPNPQTESQDQNSPFDIDSSLLSPDQKALVSSLVPPPLTTTNTTTDRNSAPISTTNIPTSHSISTQLQSLTSNLEFTVDSFADGIHTLSSFREMADRVAGRVLELSALTLEERDRRGRRKAAIADEDENEDEDEDGEGRGGNSNSEGNDDFNSRSTSNTSGSGGSSEKENGEKRRPRRRRLLSDVSTRDVLRALSRVDEG